MLRNASPLDRMQVAAPCTASWERMKGTDEARFCDQCGLHVYNISEMTRAEASDLIRETEGRLCVKLYRRQDGTVITSNCPKGLRVVWRRIIRTAGAVLAAILSGASWTARANASPSAPNGLAQRSVKRLGRSKKPRRVRRRIVVVSTMGVLIPEERPADVQPVPQPVVSVPVTPITVEMPTPPPPVER
jgi:hypothetical protein